MRAITIKRGREATPRYLKVESFDDIAALKSGQIVGSETGFRELPWPLWEALAAQLSHTWDVYANGQTYRLGEVK